MARRQRQPTLRQSTCPRCGAYFLRTHHCTAPPDPPRRFNRQQFMAYLEQARVEAGMDAGTITHDQPPLWEDT